MYTQHAVIEPFVLPAASGGDGALTYALSPERLPAGLTFDPTTQVLSGLPTAATGPRTYEYTATDADGDRASLTFTIEVVASAADQAIFKDGLAAQGRALLSGATGVIGARFRNPVASSLAGVGVAECMGEAPGEASPGPTEVGGAGATPDEPRDDADRDLDAARGPVEADAGAQPEDCTTGLLATVAEAILGMSGVGGGPPATDPDSLDLVDADETRPRGPRAVDVGIQPTWNWESLVWGRSFAVPLKKSETPGSAAWTLWGAGDMQGFQGTPRAGSVQWAGPVTVFGRGHAVAGAVAGRGRTGPELGRN